MAKSLASVLPDGGGSAVFPGVEPGLYEVIAELSPEVILRRHHEHAGEGVQPVVIAARAELSGKVTEGWEGKAIPGVQVDCRGWVDPLRVEVRAVTDREGRFAVVVPAARYSSFTAQAEGWLSARALEKVRDLPVAPNAFLVKSAPGIRSLELANELFESGEVVRATPNWWRELGAL